MDKTKLYIYLSIVGIAAIGIGGFIVLVALERPTSAYVTVLTSMVTTLIVAGGLGANQVKQGNVLKAVATSVNGNTSALLDYVKGLVEENKALRSASSDTVARDIPAASVPSEETITRISDANDAVAAHADEA